VRIVGHGKARSKLGHPEQPPLIPVVMQMKNYFVGPKFHPIAFGITRDVKVDKRHYVLCLFILGLLANNVEQNDLFSIVQRLQDAIVENEMKKWCIFIGLQPLFRDHVQPRAPPVPSQRRPQAVKIRDVPCTQGTAMTRILDDILLFACATGLVTGIVLAAATLLI
jgi:hypothetical protein